MGEQVTKGDSPTTLTSARLESLREVANRHLLFYGRDFSDSIIIRASGAYIYDAFGRAILDFSSGQMCSTIGHNHPVVQDALTQSAKDMVHLDSTKLSPPVIDLARELTDMLPDELQRAMFLNTGSESNEAAIRLAKIFTDGFEICAFDGSWHGMTGASQASTYASGRRGHGPTMPGMFALPPPNAYRCPIRHCQGTCDNSCLEVGFEQYDNASVGEGAAVIIEPIQSANGIIVPPKGYLKKLKEFCVARGMLLIFDEAQTGLGRVGTDFCFDQEQVTPDILTLSKTLGAGVPLSATITSDEVNQDARAKRFNFYTSHVSDPMPSAVGLAVLRLIKTEGLTQRAAQMGDYLTDALKALQEKYEVIGDVRGRGLLMGVELVTDRESKTPAHELMDKVTRRCFELGLNINKAGGRHAVWRLAPPLTITKSELDIAIEILDQAIQECGGY